MDAPCGFPIVTEKRSSSKITTNQSAFKECGSEGADSNPSFESVNDYKAPIRECSTPASPGSAGSTNEMPIVVTALETNVAQNITALMTIRYYDEVKRQCTRFRAPSLSEEGHDRNTSTATGTGRATNAQYTLSIETTITTVAHVSIHISVPSGPFQSSSHSYVHESDNAEDDTQCHRIVLSAMASTKEININYDDDDPEARTQGSDRGIGLEQHHWETSAYLTPPPLYHEYTFSDVEPQLTFSSNGKYLAFIIPRPIRKREQMPKDDNKFNRLGPGSPRSGSGSINMVSIKPCAISSLVICNLEAPTVNRADNGDASFEEMDELPLPTYLQLNESYNDEEQGQGYYEHIKKYKNDPALIATNPQIVSLCPLSSSASKDLSRLLTQITCLVDLNQEANISFDKGKKISSAPLLMVGCTDGSMLVIAYKHAITLGIAFRSKTCVSDNIAHGAALDGDITHSRWNGDASNSMVLQKFGWDGQANGLRTLKYKNEGDDKHDKSPVKGLIRGRLLGVQRDGRMVMFATTFLEANSCDAVSNCHRPSGQIPTMIWRDKKYVFEMTVEPIRGLTGNSVTSYTNGAFVDFDTIAVLVKPLHFERQGSDVKFVEKICQVWCIDPARSGVKLLAALCLDYVKLEGMQHGSFSLPNDDSILTSGIKCPSAMQHQTYIQYDRMSGCLSISSAIPLSRRPRLDGVDAKIFALLWDWRTCTIGFTLSCRQNIHYSYPSYELQSKKSTLTPDTCVISQQYLHRRGGETKILHMYGHEDCYSSDKYAVGILSPARCRRSNRGLEDQNPILLSRNNVMYPDLLQPSVSKDIQVAWKQSKLPLAYIAKHGPVVSAVIGNRFGRSIAVIGSKGLCVLDIHREDATQPTRSNNVTVAPYSTACAEGFACQLDKFDFKSRTEHWRMFKRQWRMFKRMDEQTFTVKSMVWWEQFNNTKEDIILAIIEYADKKDPKNYLVGWSSHRLEMREYQLILDVSKKSKFSDATCKGLCLSESFAPTAMSILIREKGHNQDRAVLSITGNRNGVAYNSVVQLQVKAGDGNDTVDRILAKKYSEAILPSVSCLIDHCFLASCSFKFDLEHRLEWYNYPVILGVLQDHGLSLSALRVESTGIVQEAAIANLWKKSANLHRITEMWRSDFAPATSQSDDTGESSAWTWSFLKANGGIFSWSLGDNEFFKVAGNESSFALHCSVQSDDASSSPSFLSFGIKSDDSKTLKGSISDESTILLGILPCTNHRHLLYSGQKIQRHGMNHTSALTGELYGASDFDIGIPSLTGGILLNLSFIVEFQLSGQEQIAEDLLVQMCYNIQRRHNSETTFAALRAIISFLTELISKKEDRSLDEEAERKRVLKSMQAALTRITMSALVQVQFISLFLNVGRQLEPHHFKSLFPLSLSSDIQDSTQILTLQDLFDMAVEDGSFSVPSAALPLFSNKKAVHRLCINLLHHCIVQVFNLNDSSTVDTTCLREECRSIQQLYSYILKVEDSERLLHLSSLESPNSENLRYESRHDSFEYGSDESIECESTDDEFSLVGSSTRSSYENHVSEQRIKSPGRISRLASRLTTPFKSRQAMDENAITEAATSFIRSTYEYKEAHSVDSESSNDSLSISDSLDSSDEEEEITAYFEDRAAFSGSGIIGMSIVSTTFFVEDISPENISRGLRNVGTLSMLLSNEKDSRSSSSPDLKAVKESIADMSDQDFMFSMEVLENIHADKSHQINANSRETSFMAANFMEILLVQGSKEWNDKIAIEVVEVISDILSRSENCPEISLLSPLLLMVAIAACHVANKGYEVFSGSNSVLADIYASCVGQDEVAVSTEWVAKR